MFNNLLKVVTFLGMMSLVFYAGMKWENFQYTDLCLDMGGGRNPGDYGICVIEKKLNEGIENNPNLKDGVYYCDELGNKFVSPEEARKHGLSDSEFGATFCSE